MKRITLALATIAALAVVPVAWSEEPPVTPFPAAHTGDVFVSAETVTTDGALSNFYAPGSTVVFRAYGVVGKTRKVVTSKTAKYFYVKIPNQPNLKLKYTPRGRYAKGRYVWTAKWNVPADYATGVVAIKVVVRTKSKRAGSFVQIPVASSQLTITNTPQSPPAAGPTSPLAPAGLKLNFGFYVDSVNGTRPAGTTPRPIGCTQTNVFKRGEQFVLRVWGFDLSTGAVLSMDNVTEAHFSVPGVANIKLNWGSHGAVGNKVWFWTNQWQIPKDYPLGDSTVRVSFTTIAGKTATTEYQITIIP